MAKKVRMLPITGRVLLTSAKKADSFDIQPGSVGNFTINDVTYCVSDAATGLVLDAEPLTLLSIYDKSATQDVTNGEVPLNGLRKLLPYRLANPIGIGNNNTWKCRASMPDAAFAGGKSYDVLVTFWGELVE